jgi:hypothetical protein
MPKFLNLESIGQPIAQIKNGAGKMKNKIIYVDSNGKSLHGFNELKIQGDDTYFQLIPNPKIERQILYIAGCIGSGKSYFTKLYLKEYEKLFPKNTIYMFSPIGEDESLEGVKINYIKIEPELLDDKLTAEDFKDSMVIWDDCEAIENKALRNECTRILNSILTTGRHYNVSCILTYPEICAGIATKKILNESHSITWFPKTLGTRSMKYLCDQYLGMSKDEIARLKKLKTRAVTVIKSYPKIVLSEKQIYCLCDDSDSDSSESSDSEEEIIFSKNKSIVKRKKDNKFITNYKI